MYCFGRRPGDDRVRTRKDATSQNRPGTVWFVNPPSIFIVLICETGGAEKTMKEIYDALSFASRYAPPARAASLHVQS
jgi:hypothetical protein